MKKSLYGLVFFTSIILTACAQSRNIQEEAYNDEPNNSISYQQFYDDLSPYGQWIDNPDYGRVWSPRENGFRPYYSNGNWVYTNYGWTWVSNYNWGWATFHYGRWFYDNFDGWMWVPGYEWAPAWVNWRGNSQYYGWAPMCPRRNDGRYYENQNDQWAFVPHQYINRRDVNNYYVKQQNNVTIINNTTVINNTNNTTVINNNTNNTQNTTRTFNNVDQYHKGPNVAEVEKVTRTKIKPLAIRQSNSPGSPQLDNGSLHIYKPSVKPNTVIVDKVSKINNASGTQPLNSETQQVDKKIISTEIRPDIRSANGNVNNNFPEKKLQPVTKDNLRKINSENINKNEVQVKENPVPVNNERQLSPTQRNIRQKLDQQPQAGAIDQPNQNEVRSKNIHNEVKQIQQNNLPERRTMPSRQNLPPVVDQQQRSTNTRQQSPSINQTQVRERPSTNIQRPSYPVEKKEQGIPNSINKGREKINR